MHKTNTLLAMAAVLLTMTSNGQVYHWSHSYGLAEPLYPTYVYHTDIDDAGNVYSIGTFYDTLDLDHGPGVQNVVSVGQRDIYVRRINADGSFGWGCSYGTTGNDEPHDLQLDNAGRLVIMGMCPFVFTISNGGGSYSFVPVNNYGLHLIRFNSDGQVLDGVSLPGGNAIGTRRFGVANNGDYVIGGSFRNTCDFDPGSGVVNATSLISSTDDWYLLRLSDNFAFQWVQHTFHSFAFNEFDFDTQGNIVIIGSYVSAPDFDPGPGQAIFQTPNWNYSGGYVAKYTALGDFLWVKGWYQSQGSASAAGVALDPDDNVYVVGQFSGTVDFETGPGTVTATADGSVAGYLLKVAPGGTVVWVREVGQRPTPPMFVGLNGLEWTIGSTLLVSGTFTGAGVDIDPGVEADSVYSTGSDVTAFLLELDTTGALNHRNMFDGSGGIAFYDVRMNVIGEIAGVGVIQNGAVDMDPDAPIDSLAVTPGLFTAFNVKFGVGPLSVAVVPDPQRIVAYPDPGTDHFMLPLVNEPQTILLLDMHGRVVRTQKANGITKVVTEDLSTGLYTYLVRGSEGRTNARGKWVKE